MGPSAHFCPGASCLVYYKPDMWLFANCQVKETMLWGRWKQEPVAPDEGDKTAQLIIEDWVKTCTVSVISFQSFKDGWLTLLNAKVTWMLIGLDLTQLHTILAPSGGVNLNNRKTST